MLRGEDSIRKTSDKSSDETAYVLQLQEEFSKDTDKPEYLLLLDGLNEASFEEILDVEGSKYFIRAFIIDEIKRLLEKCPNVRVIFTSRTDEPEINCEDYDIHKHYLSGVDKQTVVKFLMDNDMPKAKAEASCAPCEMEQKQRFQITPTEIAKIIQPILTGNAENDIPSDISIIGQYGVNYFKDYANSNNKT